MLGPAGTSFSRPSTSEVKTVTCPFCCSAMTASTVSIAYLWPCSLVSARRRRAWRPRPCRCRRPGVGTAPSPSAVRSFCCRTPRPVSSGTSSPRLPTPRCEVEPVDQLPVAAYGHGQGFTVQYEDTDRSLPVLTGSLLHAASPALCFPPVRRRSCSASNSSNSKGRRSLVIGDGSGRRVSHDLPWAASNAVGREVL